MFSYLKFLNSTLNLGDNKTNHEYIKIVKIISSICHYLKSNFDILKKDVLNCLNNNLGKNFLQSLYKNIKLSFYLFFNF